MSDALLKAVQSRDVDRMATLLIAGADPNEPGKSRYGSGLEFPLQAAIGTLEDLGEGHPAGPIDTVVLLLRRGAEVKVRAPYQDGDPHLIAVSMNHIEAARLLLAHGADPNIKDDEGM